MLDGRVKTLHPNIHGGILADLDKSEHIDAIRDHGITAIDLVVCNLYPFSSNPSIELIDIGGPAMVRAAAKNHRHVGVVTSPTQYAGVLEEIIADGKLSDATRHDPRARGLCPHVGLRRRGRPLVGRRWRPW